MSSPLENPTVRHLMGFSSATIVLVVAFAFLDGPIRWALVALAAVEALVVPRVLGRAVEQNQG